jgi:hypothetical protein
MDPMVGSCEVGNEPLGSINGGKFIDRVSHELCSIESGHVVTFFVDMPMIFPIP